MLNSAALVAVACEVLLEALVAGLPVLVTDVCGYAHHVAAAKAGLVLASPFTQQKLDASMLQMLQPGFLEDCKNHALDYAARDDLYSMHKTGAALIEQFIVAKPGRIKGRANE